LEIILDKLLSIVIPSHNKTEFLLEAIKSILAEEGFDERCEVCVSDNSLSETTSIEVAKKYAGDERLVYRRSLDSPSLDENVARAVSMARGKYVWIFGDDDLIISGSMKLLLATIESSNCEIYILNSQSFQGEKIIENQRHLFTEDKVYSPSENDIFLAEMGGYLTYLGCIIIEKKFWDENFDPTFMGSFFTHLGVLMNAKIGKVARFIAEPVIMMRLYHQTWTADYYRIWNILYPRLIWGLKGYSDEAKSRVVIRNPLRAVFSVLAARAYGYHDIKIFRAYVLTSPDCSRLLKLFHLGIVLIPRAIFRELYRVIIILGIKKRSVNFSPELALSWLNKD
jgi:glycosyltransferase involved in cell wall biosynthesis